MNTVLAIAFLVGVVVAIGCAVGLLLAALINVIGV